MDLETLNERLNEELETQKKYETAGRDIVELQEGFSRLWSITADPNDGSQSESLPIVINDAIEHEASGKGRIVVKLNRLLHADLKTRNETHMSINAYFLLEGESMPTASTVKLSEEIFNVFSLKKDRKEDKITSLIATIGMLEEAAGNTELNPQFAVMAQSK